MAHRGGIQPVVINALAALIPVLWLHHIVPDAKFLEPAVQMEPKGTALLTGHRFVRAPLLFYHEQEQFVACHLLHRLRRRAFDLLTYPVRFSVCVNTRFDDFVGGLALDGIEELIALRSRNLVPLNNLISSSKQTWQPPSLLWPQSALQPFPVT